MTLPAKFRAGWVGWLVFMPGIGGAGGIGQLGPLAIGLALCAMVYRGGHVSGAHYTPAVSFGLLLRRVIDGRTMAAYWGAQVLAALMAFTFGYLLTGHAAGVHPGANVSWLSALAAEIVFSAGLVTVVLNVAATRATAGNSFYGIAIGFTVAAGAFAVGPISGAAFNPAVGIGATVAGALFGHGSWSDLWLFLVGPFAGAAIAAGIHALQTTAEPVAPESSEQLQGEVD